MADLKSTEKELKAAIEKEKKALHDTYGDILQKLRSEREKLQGEIKGEYENARKYVKKNPETGVGVALLGGLFVGIVLSRLLRR